MMQHEPPAWLLETVRQQLFAAADSAPPAAAYTALWPVSGRSRRLPHLSQLE